MFQHLYACAEIKVEINSFVPLYAFCNSEWQVVVIKVVYISTKRDILKHKNSPSVPLI